MSRTPAPLAVAAALAAVEGLVVALLGVAETFSLSGERLTMGVTTAVFFAVYGAGLVVCGWALHRRSPWARSPVVVAQLIQLMVAWSFRGGATTAVAVALAVVAVLVLAGLLHPASTAAFREAEDAPGG